jgi:hypothetical protein
MMGAKEFFQRNKGPIAQMLIIAVLMISGIIMLQLSIRDYKPPEYNGPGNFSQNTSALTPGGDSSEKNCTPLFNSTRKISYAYDIVSSSPEGPIKMLVSYDYVGEETLMGLRTDIVEIKANSSLKNITLSPVSRLWLDYNTGQCIRAIMEMGPGYVYPINCKDAKFGMPVVTCSEQLTGLNKTRTEKIEVPAGTFVADRYEKGKEVLWIAEGVPVPVRFTFESMGSSAVAELIRFGGKT